MPKVQVEKSLNKDKIKKVADLLKNAKSVLFITGAGISADSELGAAEAMEKIWREYLKENHLEMCLI